MVCDCIYCITSSDYHMPNEEALTAVWEYAPISTLSASRRRCVLSVFLFFLLKIQTYRIDTISFPRFCGTVIKQMS